MLWHFYTNLALTITGIGGCRGIETLCWFGGCGLHFNFHCFHIQSFKLGTTCNKFEKINPKFKFNFVWLKSRQHRHWRPKSRITIIKFCVNRSNMFKVKWNILTYKCDLGGREDFFSGDNGSIVWFNDWLCNISGRCGCIAGTLCDRWRATGCRGDNYWISGRDGFSQSCV